MGLTQEKDPNHPHGATRGPCIFVFGGIAAAAALFCRFLRRAAARIPGSLREMPVKNKNVY